MKMILYSTACIILFVVPALFVWNKVYKDGVIGRLALSFISLAAALTLLKLYDGRDLDPDGHTVMLVSAFALFLVWHLVRFHHRVLQERKACGKRDNLQALLDLK
jgi:hypothetical protein